jgi:YggT family protein
MPDSLAPARYAVLALFAIAVLAALGSWLVRARHISPFRGFGRGIRTATDWIIRPVERRVVRMGGNPVNAGWWLVVVVAVVGVIALSLLGWIEGKVSLAAGAAQQGPRESIVFTVNLAYNIFFYAILIRVVAAWLGWFRYNKWMRPIYALTDWIVEPIRRWVPPLGMWDISAIVALIVLYGLKQLLLVPLQG